MPTRHLMQIFRSGMLGYLGYGVRILEAVKEGEFVCLYWGENGLGRAREERLARGHKGVRKFVMGIDGLKVNGQRHRIDAMWVGNVARWINHSRDPNLKPRVVNHEEDQTLIGLFAVRDLQPGEELTWNYQPHLFGSIAERHEHEQTLDGDVQWR